MYIGYYTVLYNTNVMQIAKNYSFNDVQKQASIPKKT